MTFHQKGNVITASMPHTLYLSSTTTSPTATLLKPPLPASPPKLLRLPSPPSSSPTISLPPNPKPSNTHLQENLFYLDSLGIDSFHCLTSHPQLVSASLPQFKSAINFLLNLDLNIHEIRRVLHMCPEILTASLPHTLRPAVTFLLREARVEGRHLPGVIRRRPRLLTRSVEEQLRPALYFLQSAVGIEDVSKCATLLSCSVETKFIPRLDYFQKLGFSKREATVMFRRFPSLFCYSIEENFEPKSNYFLVDMGRELKELLDFPQYFSFSLENRIKPRHKICVEKGVCLSLPLMLKLSEVRFWDRLEVCCSSSVPVRTSPFWCTKIDDSVT
ncbi:PREDICTED: transcription termination factor MTEF1, chloroplastic-like [Ipomoea nil]|uniref:transcription termination factor MTEF1, chloroplastic-like n=1 Tax=Ipomoea nil TaxID=35883 RepID=UPI000901ABE6|nr:PREDICTED: transcription termination factor MTEF1, chloroplastic-like [Ipomoea nil]